MTDEELDTGCLDLAEEALSGVDMDADDPAYQQLVHSLARTLQMTIAEWFHDRFDEPVA